MLKQEFQALTGFARFGQVILPLVGLKEQALDLRARQEPIGMHFMQNLAVSRGEHHAWWIRHPLVAREAGLLHSGRI